MGPPTAMRKRIYVTVVVAQIFWETGAPISWGDVHLPHGWHLSPDQVPVPPIPATGHARLAEIQRRHAQLPADLREDPACNDTRPYWDLWFEVKHAARQCTCFTLAPARRADRRPSGLYIDKLATAPQAHQPEEEDDPELHAALAASREINDLEELAK
jgi:hypothetical protein